LKLLKQPGDGAQPLVKAIKKAKKSVEVAIFRFDRLELEHALVDAVERGVFVHALIAFTNRGGERRLRDLETEFLARGITVARTSGDLVRYHGKMMLIDRKELFILGFNFTHLDMDRCRSFGLITRNPKLVQEAARLFDADTKRQEFNSEHAKLVVSPANARKELAAFIKGAKRELLIYDPKISDKGMIRLLHERMDDGVKVGVIGRAGGRLPTRQLRRLRLHVRAIIRDRRQAFIGSQSLRQVELDARREIGVIFRDAAIAAQLRHTFQEDWAASQRVKSMAQPMKIPVGKAAAKVANVVTRKLELAPIAKRVEKAIRKNGGKLGRKEVEKTVRISVKKSVRRAVEKSAREAMEEVAEQAS